MSQYNWDFQFQCVLSVVVVDSGFADVTAVGVGLAVAGFGFAEVVAVSFGIVGVGLVGRKGWWG